MAKFSLLECLHMVDGVRKVGSEIPCHYCKGTRRLVVRTASTNGSFVSTCEGCDWRCDTGTAKRMGVLYAMQHTVNNGVETHMTSTDWVENEDNP